MTESVRLAPPWWLHTTVYQIYPRSFMDANGDGIGDIAGILSKLDYLEELGVETLWCSPFFASPQCDFGYDVSDYGAIAPEYGTMEECKQLIQEVHARGMKIVFDLVMNHTSEQHPWFQASRSSREHPRRDWYIWRDGKKPDGKAPPNNWNAMIGGSGWHYDPATKQWYWATFLPFQPDLNYRHPDVKAEMLQIVRDFLTMGVDGFRLDIFNAIYKDSSFADNPFSWRPIPSEKQPDGFFQKNVHTLNHPDTLAFAKELRQLLDEFQEPPRFLVGEVFGTPKVLKQYCGDGDGLHTVFLFEALTVPLKARALRKMIEEFEENFPAPYIPTIVFGNHDRPRRIGRLAQKDPRKAALLATLQLTIRALPFIYNGEEIGTPPAILGLKGALDPIAHRYGWVPEWVARLLSTRGLLLNRDECRTPMQWDASPNAGFCPQKSSPWLPIHPDFAHCNVEGQRKEPTSLWHCYKTLLALRKEHPALCQGTMQMEESPHPNALLAYRRETSAQGLLVVLNCSERTYPIPPTWQGTILFSSYLTEASNRDIRAYEALVLQTESRGK